MPSVVVLIPANDADVATTRPALASPNRASLAPSRAHILSSPSSASPSKPSSSSSASRTSTSALYPARASPPKPRHPLLPSSLSWQHSGSSSCSSLASSSSRGLSHRSRSGHHAVPIDPANPFGPDDAYMSAKRSPADGQSLYLCQWRLRDKKDLFDANGHTYCHCRLMTADLLAKHVLAEHMTNETHPSKASRQHKTACKWGSCFNRHYDPPGLAAHLVHDHFTHQMGLKYACIVKNCSTKTILTSLDALDNHHARYHANSIGTQPLRPVLQPVRASQGQKRITRLLAALQKLDSAAAPSSKIAVSAHTNPKISLTSERARTVQEMKFKKRFLDPIDVRPGEGQDGQPWIRLHRRLQQSSDYWKSAQAADEAFSHAVDYDPSDIEDLHASATACVKLESDPTLRAIEHGLRRAQNYTPTQHERTVAWTLRMPPPDHCQVLLAKKRSSQDWVECIGPASLTSIEREMNFDAALSKQRRWVDKILKRATTASSGNALTASKDSAADGDSDSEDLADDWAPPLRLEPYHPSSRYRFVLADEDDQPAPREKQLAPRRRMEVKQEAALSDGGSSPLSTMPSTRESTPGTLADGSSFTLQSRHLSDSTVSGPAGVKRERQDDLLLLNRQSLGHGTEPPASKVKVENRSLELSGARSTHVFLHQAHSPVDELRSITPGPVFIEIAPNDLVETSPTLHRSNGFKYEPGRLGQRGRQSLSR